MTATCRSDHCDLRDSSEAIIRELSQRGLLELVDRVCASRGVTRLELCGACRSRSVAAARQELWWLLRHDPQRHFSYPELGRLFRRDHTTVLHGVAVHERRYAAPPRAPMP